MRVSNNFFPRPSTQSQQRRMMFVRVSVRDLATRDAPNDARRGAGRARVGRNGTQYEVRVRPCDNFRASRRDARPRATETETESDPNPNPNRQTCARRPRFARARRRGRARRRARRAPRVGRSRATRAFDRRRGGARDGARAMAAATRASRATAREGARGARALARWTWGDARAIRARAGDERRPGGAGRGRGVASASAASGGERRRASERCENGARRDRARDLERR